MTGLALWTVTVHTLLKIHTTPGVFLYFYSSGGNDVASRPYRFEEDNLRVFFVLMFSDDFRFT